MSLREFAQQLAYAIWEESRVADGREVNLALDRLGDRVFKMSLEIEE